MSSVRDLVESASIWREVAPALDRVTRWCNNHSESFASPVGRGESTAQAALVAETAFRLAILGNVEINTNAGRVIGCQLLLSRSRDPVEFTSPWQVEGLRQNLLSYFDPLSEFEFFPRIPGLGAVSETHADARRGDHLVEVKTVTRGGHTADLRQCLTYAAMLRASNDPIERITLVNPRSGRSASLSLAAIAVAAGSQSGADLLADLAFHMGALEVSA